ncbi:hypothetical protein O181_042825 [Austropuccinia psidii MF-1]|uniref:SNF2 N-terminal domain-containing protein n=1 Tax=Austropuccinia psidii MF-1 TaxID=1389203 RepID=A0A9Q3HIJ7_9BASI|nr:hypothetical protein [Austropuccinia psidii MF-1]
MPKEYDCNSHSQCQCFTPKTPTSILTPPLYPAGFSFSSKQKLIQLPSGTYPPMMTPPQSMMKTPLLPHQKTGLAFLWDQEIPNGKYSCNLWTTSPPYSTFDARHIITNKVIRSFEFLLTNTPHGGLLADDMGLGKSIEAIALVGTSKERLMTNPHGSTATSLNHHLAIRNIQACSGWSTAIQYLPWPH